jgi:uncharacterized protein (TIGR02757 family)
VARRSDARSDRLGAALDGLYEAYNREVGEPLSADRVTTVLDPIQIVRRFREPADQEIVGFCAAGLAFGRVASVMQSVERVVSVMGPTPAEFVRRFEPSTDGAPLEGLVHRWTRGPDLIALFWLLRQMLEQAGSIESFFLQGYDPNAEDIRPALESFSVRAMRLDLSAAYGRVPDRPGVAYFFPRPSCGSGCKRLNLYLRWMVRRDAIDLGVWSRVAPSKLIVPLDVHVIRLGRCLGLTHYTSPGWKMAAEITASLRAMHPNDPTRYDFALCHVGMRDQCGFRRPIRDARCPLRGFCRPVARRRPVSRPPSDPR